MSGMDNAEKRDAAADLSTRRTDSREKSTESIVCLIVLVLGLVLSAWAQDTVEVYRIDFGPKTTCAPGYVAIEDRSDDIRFAWRGKDLGTRDRGSPDPVKRDLVFGAEAEFVAGLDNGDYEVAMTFGDESFGHGPFDLLAQGKPVAEGIGTGPGEFVTKTFQVSVSDARLRIQISPSEGASNFAVVSMIVRGHRQTGIHSAYAEDPPPRKIPTPAELASKGDPDPRQALKLYGDFLLAHQGDSGCFGPTMTSWYLISYPVRALLAAYDVLGDTRYLQAATACLDKFVSEQLPNAAWESVFRNKPAAARTAAELQESMNGTTNTADIATMSTCLAVAYPYVDEARKAKYLGALKRYADEYALRWQLPSGAFANGRWKGQDWTVPYSVATGTQGMSFCALSVITGDRRYLKVAERATNFLLDNWQQDGRPVHHDHASDRSYVVASTSFGDIFYYHEAILWTYHWTRSRALKNKIRRVYLWHIKGPRGLLETRENGVWWPVDTGWANSKAAAMPLVLVEYDRGMAGDPEVHEAVRRSAAFLCSPEFARRIGVMCDPEAPWGEFSLSATGFGGLALAEMAKPGVIYMKSGSGRMPPGGRRHEEND